MYDAVKGPKKLITFTEEEGAGGHCETLARSVYHQRVYDGLDETLNHSRKKLTPPARPESAVIVTIINTTTYAYLLPAT